MSRLRQQLIDAMVVRGLSVRTQETYVEVLARMARHFGRSPAELDAQEIERYMLYLVRERHRSYSTINQVASASCFLFVHVLGRDGLDTSAQRVLPPLARVPQQLPELLARAEIARLFTHCPHPVVRVLLQTLYACGLRLEEGCHLRVADIDSASDRMCVRVRAGKGAADRYTLLSPTLLTLLRAHCRAHQCHRQPPGAPGWLFANPRTQEPYCSSIVQRHYQRARLEAGIQKRGSTHTLRHCFATHLLEAGVDLHTIAKLLGHHHLSTTTRYLHLISPQFQPQAQTDRLDLLAALPSAASLH
ncbi:MAG: tyrosine-type recombinase/integrase [Inhella sp.]